MKSNKYVYASSFCAHAYIGKMEGSVQIKNFHKVTEKVQQTSIIGRERKKFLVHKTKGGMSQSAPQSISEHYCLEIFSTYIFFINKRNKLQFHQKKHKGYTPF